MKYKTTINVPYKHILMKRTRKHWMLFLVSWITFYVWKTQVSIIVSSVLSPSNDFFSVNKQYQNSYITPNWQCEVENKSQVVIMPIWCNLLDIAMRYPFFVLS